MFRRTCVRAGSDHFSPYNTPLWFVNDTSKLIVVSMSCYGGAIYRELLCGSAYDPPFW